MVKLMADVERSRAVEDKGSNAPNIATLYKPAPFETGKKANNGVVISLVAPALWKMFNPTEEEAAKFGFVGAGQRVFPDPQWGHFFFKVPTHKVLNYQYEGGNKGFAYGICPVGLNQYLVQNLGINPLFDVPVRCAHCEKEEEYWNLYQQRLEALGHDNKTISKADRKQLTDKDAELKHYRDRAYDYRKVDRHIISIFDHDKYVAAASGGSEAPIWQFYYAPKAVSDDLDNLFVSLKSGDYPLFFEFGNDGVPILNLVKDTMSGDLKRTEYSLVNTGAKYPYPPEWVEYLKNEAAYADPSIYFRFLTYQDQKFYIEQAESAHKRYNKAAESPVQAQVAPPAAVMPTVAAVPQQTAPPAVAPAVPSAAPVNTAPVAAVPSVQPRPAPVPVMPPAQTAMPTPVAPVSSGAPMPNRMPPVPPSGRINWD
jgi:hypothetical protein